MTLLAMGVLYLGGQWIQSFRDSQTEIGRRQFEAERAEILRSPTPEHP